MITRISLLLLLSARLSIATTLETNGSLSDVQAKVNASVAGDIVHIPAGSFTWTSPLSVGQKAITIQGDGIGTTIITNTQGTGALPNDGMYSTMAIGTPPSGRTRVTGIEFRGNRTSNGVSITGTNWEEFQVDNCKFVEFRLRGVECRGQMKGLVYDCEFVDNYKTVDIYSGIGAGENLSWNTPLTLGTTSCVVVEDNTITYSAGAWRASTVSATASHGHGGRGVWRYNTWVNNDIGRDFSPIIDMHGNQNAVSGTNATSESPYPGGSGGHRGTRQSEIYNNTFTNNGGAGSGIRFHSCRGGTVLIYDNTYTGVGFETAWKMWEEDAPGDNNFLTTYPGYDQHRYWFHNNLRNGVNVTNLSFVNAADSTFIVTNTNVFFRMPQSGDIIYPYTALTYPHPWRNTAGSIVLSSQGYSVAEAGGTVTITASRVGGSTGAVGISYATSNGTATAGSDYTSANSTLSWSDADSADKTFTVTITSDVSNEGNESFNVALSSPTGGAELGATSTAIVTITDDDGADTVPLMGALTFEAEDGLIESPFITEAGYVYQAGDFSVSNGGLARYRVSIPSTGDYQVNITSIAQDGQSNSVWLDWDSDPTDPAMIFDIEPPPVAETERTATWRGAGTFDTPQYSPKNWTLSAGEHILYIRGREGPCFINSIEVVESGANDITAPTPNPSQWLNHPNTLSSDSLDMEAVSAGDTTTPVQYYFDETSGNPGGTDSGWQSSSIYTDTGLMPDTVYTYRVQTRDSASTPNVSSFSDSVDGRTQPLDQAAGARARAPRNLRILTVAP
jgi:hypothetical protein